MTAALPHSLAGALDALANDPDAHVLAGGTDFMVEVNFGHRRPARIIALGGVRELRGWSRTDDTVTLGAGVTFAALQREPLASLLPGLAQAARTVGSPQIRNAGTIGGNLATASPAGDALPILSALDATVVCASARGQREVSIHDFLVGPKRNALEPGELIVAIRLPRCEGPQEFLKVGTRNAMVIAVASVALVVDRATSRIRVALGSVGPTVLRARDAEAWISPRLDWPGAASARADAPADAQEFAARVAAAARPIDDHRASAAYRRHTVGVCARRALQRAFPS